MTFQNLLQALILGLLSYAAKGIKIILILSAAYLLNRFSRLFAGRIIRSRIKDKINGEQRKRAKTLISIFDGSLKFIIWIVAVLMILPELGINVAPILASLGLAGLAIGMAAKDIISDFISGFFILLEDQYSVGDKVKISEIEGVIEKVTLRKTTIKDKSGVLYSVPNSQIKIVAKITEFKDCEQ